MKHPCFALEHDIKPFGFDIKDIMIAMMFFMSIGDTVVFWIPWEPVRWLAKAGIALGLLFAATWFRENTPPGYVRDFIRWMQAPDYMYVTRDPETKPLWLEYQRTED